MSTSDSFSSDTSTAASNYSSGSSTSVSSSSFACSPKNIHRSSSTSTKKDAEGHAEVMRPHGSSSYLGNSPSLTLRTVGKYDQLLNRSYSRNDLLSLRLPQTSTMQPAAPATIEGEGTYRRSESEREMGPFRMGPKGGKNGDGNGGFWNPPSHGSEDVKLGKEMSTDTGLSQPVSRNGIKGGQGDPAVHKAEGMGGIPPRVQAELYVCLPPMNYEGFSRQTDVVDLDSPTYEPHSNHQMNLGRDEAKSATPPDGPAESRRTRHPGSSALEPDSDASQIEISSRPSSLHTSRQPSDGAIRNGKKTGSLIDREFQAKFDGRAFSRPPSAPHPGPQPPACSELVSHTGTLDDSSYPSAVPEVLSEEPNREIPSIISSLPRDPLFQLSYIRNVQKRLLERKFFEELRKLPHTIEPTVTSSWNIAGPEVVSTGDGGEGEASSDVDGEDDNEEDGNYGESAKAKNKRKGKASQAAMKRASGKRRRKGKWREEPAPAAPPPGTGKRKMGNAPFVKGVTYAVAGVSEGEDGEGDDAGGWRSKRVRADPIGVGQGQASTIGNLATDADSGNTEAREREKRSRGYGDMTIDSAHLFSDLTVAPIDPSIPSFSSFQRYISTTRNKSLRKRIPPGSSLASLHPNSGTPFFPSLLYPLPTVAPGSSTFPLELPPTHPLSDPNMAAKVIRDVVRESKKEPFWDLHDGEWMDANERDKLVRRFWEREEMYGVEGGGKERGERAGGKRGNESIAGVQDRGGSDAGANSREARSHANERDKLVRRFWEREEMYGVEGGGKERGERAGGKRGNESIAGVQDRGGSDAGANSREARSQRDDAEIERRGDTNRLEEGENETRQRQEEEEAYESKTVFNFLQRVKPTVSWWYDDVSTFLKSSPPSPPPPPPPPAMPYASDSTHPGAYFGSNYYSYDAVYQPHQYYQPPNQYYQPVASEPAPCQAAPFDAREQEYVRQHGHPTAPSYGPDLHAEHQVGSAGPDAEYPQHQRAWSPVSFRRAEEQGRHYYRDGASGSSKGRRDDRSGGGGHYSWEAEKNREHYTNRMAR